MDDIRASNNANQACNSFLLGLDFIHLLLPDLLNHWHGQATSRLVQCILGASMENIYFILLGGTI